MFSKNIPAQRRKTLFSKSLLIVYFLLKIQILFAGPYENWWVCHAISFHSCRDQNWSWLRIVSYQSWILITIPTSITTTVPLSKRFLKKWNIGRFRARINELYLFIFALFRSKSSYIYNHGYIHSWLSKSAFDFI